MYLYSRKLCFQLHLLVIWYFKRRFKRADGGRHKKFTKCNFKISRPVTGGGRAYDFLRRSPISETEYGKMNSFFHFAKEENGSNLKFNYLVLCVLSKSILKLMRRMSQSLAFSKIRGQTDLSLVLDWCYIGTNWKHWADYG